MHRVNEVTGEYWYTKRRSRIHMALESALLASTFLSLPDKVLLVPAIVFLETLANLTQHDGIQGWIRMGLVNCD